MQYRRHSIATPTRFIATPAKLQPLRQHFIATPLRLHCSSGEASLQPWRSSDDPAELHCSSGDASLQPRWTSDDHRGASLQLRRSRRFFIATPASPSLLHWLLQLAGQPAAQHRRAVSSLMLRNSSPRPPDCSMCGKWRRLATPSTAAAPRRTLAAHTMRKICAASGAALRHRPRLHYRLPRRSSRSVDRDGEVMDREGRRSQREQS